jgi:hypothetical protein
MLIVLAVLLPIIQLNHLGQVTHGSVTLEGQLVVAISSRALFDFEEENQLFEPATTAPTCSCSSSGWTQPARPGVAFSLVRKLLAFNDAGDAGGSRW